MAEGKKKSEVEFDIFIANTIYPEAVSVFAAHIEPLEELKNNAFVVLDTNALLVPYSTGKESLEQIRQTYAGLVPSQRLVIPGQVAREFAENRASKIAELFQQLTRKKNIPGLQKGRYPLLESVDAYQEAVRLEKEIDELLGEYKETIDKVLEHIRRWTWNDPVSLMYAELFGNGIVLDLQFDEEKVKEDLVWRQAHQIPPGYKDSAKEDQGIGDLLIWHTILEVGKSKEQSVIFVSGDQKADWWYRSEGHALYPRYELVDEFRRKSSGHSFHIVQFSRFLDLYGASERIVQEVRQEELKRRIELELIGEFIRKWKTLEQALLSWHSSIHPDASPRWMSVYQVLRVLLKEEIISSNYAGLIGELNEFRNRLIHESVEFPAEQIRERISRIEAILDWVWTKQAG